MMQIKGSGKFFKDFLLLYFCFQTEQKLVVFYI